MGKLRKAGMNIGEYLYLFTLVLLTPCLVRLNASHGDHDYFRSVVDNARQVVAGTFTAEIHPPAHPTSF